jgi:hypothetical protein
VKRYEVVLGGRFTSREGRIVEQAAEADGCTVSEYVRSAVLTTAVLDGNLEAIKLLGGLSAEKLADTARALLRVGKRRAA